jgi:phosphoesterase RecJ-like protein
VDPQADLQRVASAIRSHNSFVVLSHEKPDGDAVGSGLAMVLALHALGKRAILVTADPLPAVL